MADYGKYRGLDLGATEPVPDLDAPEGYPRDPDPGEGLQGSAITAFFIDYPRQVLHRAITALGGSPDIRDPGKLATVLGDALGAVLGWPAGEVRVGSTPRSLAAVAATAAGFAESASRSLIAAAQSCVVKGARALVGASRGSTVWGSDSALLASRNAVLTGDNRLGGGYSATAPTTSETDQNLTWTINSQTGEIKAKSLRTSGVLISDGGAVGANSLTAQSATIGTVTVGEIKTSIATVTAEYVGGVSLEWVADAGTASVIAVTLTNDSFHRLSANFRLTVATSAISAGSLILLSHGVGDSMFTVAPSVRTQGDGTVTINLLPVGSGTALQSDPWEIVIHLLIVNPTA